MQGVVNNKLVFRADLYIITGFELPVFHMILRHAHISRIGICFAVTVSFAKTFFLLFILLQSSSEVLYHVTCFGFSLGTGLFIPFEYFINLLSGFLHLLFIYFFKIRRGRILVFFISNALGILPHLFKLLHHFLLAGLYGVAPSKSISPGHRFDLGTIGIDLL